MSRTGPQLSHRNSQIFSEVTSTQGLGSEQNASLILMDVLLSPGYKNYKRTKWRPFLVSKRKGGNAKWLSVIFT